MNQVLVERIVRQADQLTVEEQLLLIERLARRAQERSGSAASRKWSELRGSLPYPALGEDAQAWVSRTRNEDDIERRLGQGQNE